MIAEIIMETPAFQGDLRKTARVILGEDNSVTIERSEVISIFTRQLDSEEEAADVYRRTINSLIVEGYD